MQINKSKKTIIICSNYGWTIYNFRFSLIKELKKRKYKVIVITQFDGYEKKIAKEVDEIYPLNISREGINPFVDIITFFDLFNKFKKYKPDEIFCFTIKPVIYGALAARFLNIKMNVMITGLGTVFIKKNWITTVVKLLYRVALKDVKTAFFQNKDDKFLFIKNKLIKEDQCKLVPGSGVDTDKFHYIQLTDDKITNFLFIGRMIKDKGINELIDAAKKLREENIDFKLQFLGPCEVQNRTAISKIEIMNWEKEGLIEYLGETNDVRKFITDTHCVVLPSYREGTPKSLLESCSMGRPVLATDVPGCREVVEHGNNGLLCAVENSNDLADKMKEFIEISHKDRIKMGEAGRLKIKNTFSDIKVLNIMLSDLS
tara:strand:- start:1630 stop:2745 length:1116 start_codon:yes stop_codon:yes gene_type:complete